MATKLTKPGKRAKRDKVNIDGIIGILPLLSDVFNTDPPTLSTEDLLSGDADRVFELYNFFLRCMSLTSAEELAPLTIKPTNIKTEIFNKDIFYTCHKVRFFFAVREMMMLASAPSFCFKDLSAPDISRTIIFAKTLINFLRFYSDECIKNLKDKQEEESLRWEVGLLKKEVNESEESYEMNLAKADMEENAKVRMQEDITATNSELETVANTVPVETIRMQESEKTVLHSKERISEAKLYLIEKQRNSERQTKLIVTSPDKLLEQRNASKRTLESLCEEQQSLEVQISQCKKLEAYDKILKEFEIVSVSCREFEPLLRDTDVAKQKSANLIREKEELQASLQALLQDKALLIKRLDNLRERRERLTSSAQQLHGDNVSKFPNEVDMLKDEFENNLENIDDVKLDIASLNEVMRDYRNRFLEHKDKLIAYQERFTRYYRTQREELGSKVTKLEDFLMRGSNS